HGGGLHLHREPLQHPRHGRAAGHLRAAARQHHGAGHRPAVRLRGHHRPDLGRSADGPDRHAHQSGQDRWWALMLFFLKNSKSKQLEDARTERQKQGPAGAWAGLPQEELFTPAGFRAEEAEATASSNSSYWGSTLRSFLKNKFAVALLIALVAVVG